MPFLLPFFCWPRLPRALRHRDSQCAIVDGTGSPLVRRRHRHSRRPRRRHRQPSGRSRRRTIDGAVWWWRRGSSTCWAIRKLTILVNPICRRRSIRASLPRSPAKAVHRRPLTTPWPGGPRDLPALRRRATWRTFREYFGASAENRAWGSTWPATVGATQVRRVVIGDGNRAPTAARTGAHEGAGPRRHARWGVGLSTSLQTPRRPLRTTKN